MINVPSRTLRDYLSTLPIGNSAGVVGQNLELVTGLATMGQAVPLGGTTGQVLTKVSNADLAIAWTSDAGGDMLKSVYDPQNKNADAFARANQTGTQSVTTITGLAAIATSGSYVDLTNKPAFGTLSLKNQIAVPGDISATGTPSSTTALFGDGSWKTLVGGGDMLKSVYDPTNINASAFARSNHTGTQPASTITGLATVATTGAYANLSGLPTLGTAAAQNTTAFATAAQGTLADSAVQPAATQTLTNKRITPRFTTIASTATLTPNANTEDMTAVTAQAVALTIAAPTGTPTNGQTLTIRIKDNGVARTMAWNAAYSAFLTDDLRTTTVASKTLIFQFIYNATDTVWDLLHSNASLGIWS